MVRCLWCLQVFVGVPHYSKVSAFQVSIMISIVSRRFVMSGIPPLTNDVSLLVRFLFPNSTSCPWRIRNLTLIIFLGGTENLVSTQKMPYTVEASHIKHVKLLLSSLSIRSTRFGFQDGTRCTELSIVIRSLLTGSDYIASSLPLRPFTLTWLINILQVSRFCSFRQLIPTTLLYYHRVLTSTKRRFLVNILQTLCVSRIVGGHHEVHLCSEKLFQIQILLSVFSTS